MPGPRVAVGRPPLCALLLGSPRALRQRRRKLRELYVRVRREPSTVRLRSGEVRSPRADKGRVRPRQRLPSEREHKTGATAGIANTRPSACAAAGRPLPPDLGAAAALSSPAPRLSADVLFHPGQAATAQSRSPTLMH